VEEFLLGDIILITVMLVNPKNDLYPNIPSIYRVVQKKW